MAKSETAGRKVGNSRMIHPKAPAKRELRGAGETERITAASLKDAARALAVRATDPEEELREFDDVEEKLCCLDEARIHLTRFQTPNWFVLKPSAHAALRVRSRSFSRGPSE
jgi:hypothetical protein